MASTYTSSLTLQLIGNGEQSGTWGTTTNGNWQAIEDSVAGVAQVTISGTSGATLSVANAPTSDQARKAVIVVTGAASGTNAIIAPLQPKVYIISNQTTGGFNITIGATTGSAVTIPNGVTTLVYCDGTNFYSGITGFTGGNLSISGSITATGTITGNIFATSGGIPQLAGGAANQIHYQTGVNATGYIAAPGTSTTTFLSYIPGTGFAWQASSTTASNINGGSTNALVYQSSANNTTFLANPGTGTTYYLTYNNGLVWTTGGAVASVSATAPLSNAGTSTNPNIALTGTVPIANGGTGSSSFAAAGLLTTSTGAQLASSNNFTTSGQILMAASSLSDSRIQVSYSSNTTAISPTTIQLGLSGYYFGYDSVANAIDINTPSFGANAKFVNTSSGYNYQGNNNASWQTVSDINIKTNLHPITGVLDKLNALKPCHFEYKDKAGEIRTGFIAQEYESVFPGHVGDIPAEEKYLKYLPQGQTTIKTISQDLIPYLVQAIQELSAEVEALKAQLAK